MNRWRTDSLLKLGRIMVLLLLLGQSALLIHEAGHTSASADSECQLCLHAKPQLSAVLTLSSVTVDFDHVTQIAALDVQPVYFSPVYSNSSRGPPRA